MSDALDRLIDALRTGDRPHDLTKEVFGHDSLNMMHAMCALNPKHPDLNCALHLMGDLLPGAIWLVGGGDQPGKFSAAIRWAGRPYEATSITPARAVILATLLAYRETLAATGKQGEAE